MLRAAKRGRRSLNARPTSITAMTSDAGNKLNSSSIVVAAVDVVASDFADITVAAGLSFPLCSPDCALAQKIAVHIPQQIINATFSNLYIKPLLKFDVNRGFSYLQYYCPHN